MKIAVNTRLLLPNKLDGIGWFTYETLKRITTQHPEHDFFFLFDRKHSEEFIFSRNIEPVIVHPQSRHPLLWYLFFEWGVPAALNKLKPDLFLSPDGWLSLRTETKSVTVIHDLNFETYPQFLPFHVRKYYKYFVPRFAHKAERIATVSEFTKSDIVQKYGISPERIDVVYNGANEKFVPLTADEISGTRQIYTAGNPYFIFVGTIHPRKNMTNMFRAYNHFRRNHASNVRLLIIGEKKWWTSDIRKAYEEMRYKEDVIFAGRLGEEELHRVIASALAMIYVSYFEGFGIPILESFYCDVPVITSDATSMPEVAGDAALLTDPFSFESISEAMFRISTDEKLRKSLVEKGRVRRKLFNWQKSADKLWETILKVT
jgi:glycosyltransferase involved in cell wall biosynthesis